MLGRDGPLGLTPRELHVLRRLMKNAGRVVTKAQLTEALAALNEDIGDKTVEVYVHRIRQKIQGNDVEIVTVRGFGYLLRDSVASLAVEPRAHAASLRRRLLVQLALPLLVLFILDGALSAWAARRYADASTTAGSTIPRRASRSRCGSPAGQAALNLPRVAQEMFEWDAEDRVLFRVEGSRSGLIAGRDVPRTGARGAVLQRAAVRRGSGGRADALGRLRSPCRRPGRGGDHHRRRDHAQARPPRRGDPALGLGAADRAPDPRRLDRLSRIVVQTEKLHALSVSLRDMSYRKLSAVPGDNMPAEMQPLIEALNALIGKLDAAALAHRTFIANAAHQLRTPLTALNLQAEQALHCGSLREMRQAVERLQEAVHRSTRLANQLLLLSRAEPEAQSGANRRADRPLRARVRDGARVGAGRDGRVDRPRLRRGSAHASSRSTRRSSPRRSTTSSTTRSSIARRARG